SQASAPAPVQTRLPSNAPCVAGPADDYRAHDRRTEGAPPGPEPPGPDGAAEERDRLRPGTGPQRSERRPDPGAPAPGHRHRRAVRRDLERAERRSTRVHPGRPDARLGPLRLVRGDAGLPDGGAAQLADEPRKLPDERAARDR